MPLRARCLVRELDPRPRFLPGTGPGPARIAGPLEHARDVFRGETLEPDERRRGRGLGEVKLEERMTVIEITRDDREARRERDPEAEAEQSPRPRVIAELDIAERRL